MVSNIGFTVSARFRNNISKAATSALRSIGKAGTVNFKQINNEVKRTSKQIRTFTKTARMAAKAMNEVLGGRTTNFAGKANGLGQNISGISNRLGFMAFQWNFMANAASRAVDTIVGGMLRIVTEGAKMGDSLTRALAFATEAQGIRDMTDIAKKDISELRDAIFQEGSGKNIFGIEEISNVARELAKAFPDARDTKNILPFVAQLKTLEPQLSDEKIGAGLVSLFATLGTNTKDIQEIGAAMDFLSNVSDRSTANFQSSIASLGIASQQAKQIGITAFETGAIIQQVSDVLARNVGGGRASATAGRFANAFFADLGKISDVTSKQGAFAESQNLDIFVRDAKTGQRHFKDLVGIVEVLRGALDGLGNADRAEYLSRLGLTTNSQKTLNALLIKSQSELSAQIELLKERGVLEARSAATATSAQSQILRIQAALNSLKISISNGFAPALFELANQMSEIAAEQEFKELMTDIGNAFSNILIPAIKQGTQLVKLFFGFLVKNRKTLNLAIKGVVALVAALIGLQIIATIGFFAFVAGASIGGMTGQMFLATAAVSALRIGFTTLYATILPVALAGLGIALIFGSFTDIFDRELRPAMFGLGIAFTAAGVGVLFFRTQLTGALLGLPGKIAGVLSSISLLGTRTTGAFLGKGLTSGFVASARGIPKAFTGILQLLRNNRAGVIGLAIALGAAFVLGLNAAIQGSPIFQGGLATYWEEAGFLLLAAVGKTVRAIYGFLKTLGDYIREIYGGIAEYVGNAFGALADYVNDPLNPEKLEKFYKALTDISTVDLTNVFKSLASADFLATQKLTATFQRLREQLSAGTYAGNPLDEKELRRQIKFIQDAAGSNLTIKQIVDTVNKAFGSNLLGVKSGAQIPQGPIDVDDPSDYNQFRQPKYEEPELGFPGLKILQDAIGSVVPSIGVFKETIDMTGTELQETIKGFEEQTGIIGETTKTIEKGKKAIDGYIGSTLTGADIIDTRTAAEKMATQITGVHSTSTDSNTGALDVNTKTTYVDIDTIEEKIYFQKRQILEFAKNINSVAAMTVRTEQVNLAMSKFAIELTEAARRVSTLQVSDSGKFSISGRATNTTFSEIGPLSQQISQQAANVGLAQREFQEGFININALSASLDALTVQIAAAAQGPVDAAVGAADLPSSQGTGQTTISAGNGKYVVADRLANGVTRLDINVDGTFDINVQQGGLTTEQILELQATLGEALTNAIRLQLSEQT